MIFIVLHHFVETFCRRCCFGRWSEKIEISDFRRLFCVLAAQRYILQYFAKMMYLPKLSPFTFCRILLVTGASYVTVMLIIQEKYQVNWVLICSDRGQIINVKKCFSRFVSAHVSELIEIISLLPFVTLILPSNCFKLE